MNEKQRVNLMLDADVIEMLDGLAGSERKRGLYLSDLIRAAHVAHQQNANLRTMDVEAMRLMIVGLAGRVISVEGQIAHLETELAAMRG